MLSLGMQMSGLCEKHQLPLDSRGQCELCRLSAIPSKSAPSRFSAWWVVGALILLGGSGASALLALGNRSASSSPRLVTDVSLLRPAAPSRRAINTPTRGPGDDGPTRVPLPPDREPLSVGIHTAPAPPPLPEQPRDRSFTEDDARTALGEVHIEMYATTWCGSCRQAREYLDYNGITYTEYDIDRDESASSRLALINPRKSIPTFQIDEIVQIGFSPDSMERKLNEAARKRLLR